jgi:hypothetical protein
MLLPFLSSPTNDTGIMDNKNDVIAMKYYFPNFQEENGF